MSRAVQMLSSRPIIAIIACICLGLLLIPTARSGRFPHVSIPIPKLSSQSFSPFTGHADPSVNGTEKIIGLVFYGRREFVEILDCYLLRNLKENGGILDEVIFSVNTDDEQDVEWLDQLVAKRPDYTIYRSKTEYLPESYQDVWGPVSREHIYIKIDDDTVYIEDDTIDSIVKRLKSDPKYFMVSANVINNPPIGWLHHSMGLVKPYFPELEPPAEAPKPSWRASELPFWTGPAGFEFDGSKPAPFKGHRWLPVQDDIDIVETAARDIEHSGMGLLMSWAASAQVQYSFLDHLEKNELEQYRYGVWDFFYERISINFLAIRGSDVVESYPFPGDDELYLTVEYPRRVKRHVVADGGGTAAHFAYRSQRNAHESNALDQTDLLSRYKAYADEMVCPFPKREQPYNSLWKREMKRR